MRTLAERGVRISDIPWFGIIVTLVVVVFLAGAVWLIWGTIDDYRRQCHNEGGHIISVRNNETCVDHDGKVIFI